MSHIMYINGLIARFLHLQKLTSEISYQNKPRTYFVKSDHVLWETWSSSTRRTLYHVVQTAENVDT